MAHIPQAIHLRASISTISVRSAGRWIAPVGQTELHAPHVMHKYVGTLPELPKRGISVLLVEPSSMQAHLVQRMLANQGVKKVTVVETASAALAGTAVGSALGCQAQSRTNRFPWLFTSVFALGAMLAGLGFNPFYAAGICLLANTAPVAFGSIGIPITTLIFRNYYAEIPNELIEASKIDGAGILGIYRHILFPISMPGFVVVMIWQFTAVWNEFLFAYVMIDKNSQMTIPVGLSLMIRGDVLPWGELCAAALIMSANCRSQAARSSGLPASAKRPSNR